MVNITINRSTIELVEGDITKQETGAIVNAANPGLLGGSGVDGAIHKAGGPQIQEECRKLGGCPTGEARITTGGNLKARYIIHTVGPIYHNGKQQEAELLSRAYRNSLNLASQYKLKSIAFPSISTGAYGYPVDAAAKIAIKTVMDYINTHTDIELVRFVLFDQRSYQAYKKALEELIEQK
ncbi:MAG: O-acetyl-ADP-ribose deacetylase [wastewater metagenome]|nr:O-acetyl-ADP-ribose deacetylase [Candidatus Loosdrechtia aerotolerans]